MDTISKIHPKVKSELISIYSEIKDICARHDIKFTAASGTLLGAVRHHGFIPWDDDFDLFMLRNEYERFIKIVESELPKNLKLITFRNTKEYPLMFCKIQEIDDNVYEEIEKDAKYVNPHGLYVDIFPLDGVPGNLLSRIIDFVRFSTAYCRRSYLFRRDNHGSLIGKFLSFIGWLLYPFYFRYRTANDFAYLFTKWSIMYNVNIDKEVRYVHCEERFQKRELRFPASIFDKIIDVKFENISVPIPYDYHTALCALYGENYMTPPPPEKRYSEHSKSSVAPWKYGPTGGKG